MSLVETNLYVDSRLPLITSKNQNVHWYKHSRSLFQAHVAIPMGKYIKGVVLFHVVIQGPRMPEALQSSTSGSQAGSREDYGEESKWARHGSESSTCYFWSHAIG